MLVLIGSFKNTDGTTAGEKTIKFWSREKLLKKFLIKITHKIIF